MNNMLNEKKELFGFFKKNENDVMVNYFKNLLNKSANKLTNIFIKQNNDNTDDIKTPVFLVLTDGSVVCIEYDKDSSLSIGSLISNIRKFGIDHFMIVALTNKKPQNPYLSNSIYNNCKHICFFIITPKNCYYTSTIINNIDTYEVENIDTSNWSYGNIDTLENVNYPFMPLVNFKEIIRNAKIRRVKGLMKKITN